MSSAPKNLAQKWISTKWFHTLAVVVPVVLVSVVILAEFGFVHLWDMRWWNTQRVTTLATGVIAIATCTYTIFAVVDSRRKGSSFSPKRYHPPRGVAFYDSDDARGLLAGL